MKNKELISIVGPTAVGKTALAIALAQKLGTEIISCDSRQFYTEMRIGTAQPTEEELSGVRHHFIGEFSVKRSFSVGDFEKEALARTSQCFENHDQLILVGGSGLYEKALCEGLHHLPNVQEGLREELSQRFEDEGIEPLQRLLKKHDFAYYQKVDLQNPRRLLRALELILSTGMPYSELLKPEKQQRAFKVTRIGIDMDRPILYDRINQRVDAMVELGLLEEVESLLPFSDLNALKTVGYQELFPYFQGACSLDFALEEIKKNTRRYAKRQWTWFRKYKEITWLEPSKIATFVDNFY